MRNNVHCSLIVIGGLLISYPLTKALFDEQEKFLPYSTQHLVFYDYSNPEHPCGLSWEEILNSRYFFIKAAELYIVPSSPHAVGFEKRTLVPGKHQSTEIALIGSNRPNGDILSTINKSVPLRLRLPNYCKSTDKWKFKVLSTEVDTSGLSISNLIYVNLVMIFSLTIMTLYLKAKPSKKSLTGMKQFKKQVGHEH